MSFLGGSDGGCGECGPSGANAGNQSVDEIALLSPAELMEKTLVMVRDLSTMLKGKRDREIEGLAKSIASEISPIANKREYFRTLSAKFTAFVDEYRNYQADAEQRIANELRQVVGDFAAGVPLPTDGRLSFE
jgi:hypothetical protein